jgi:hypothetical protein
MQGLHALTSASPEPKTAIQIGDNPEPKMVTPTGDKPELEIPTHATVCRSPLRLTLTKLPTSAPTILGMAPRPSLSHCQLPPSTHVTLSPSR